MKHIILLCDGMADLPLQQLEGKTPMTVAHKPHMNALANKGHCGMVQTVSPGFSPGSDVANLSVLGYDPTLYYTGRSPLEAASIGIAMSPDDVALRCNLVTLSQDEPFADKTMLDYCADDISTDEAQQIIQTLQQQFDGSEFHYYTGTAYRHCLIWHGGTDCLGGLTPPHDITGKKITQHIPSHPDAQKLRTMMEQSVALLKDHPVNLRRIQQGRKPANAIWLWGEGKSTTLPDFYQHNGLKGAVISAVDLLKGIATLSGMNPIEVDGATGYIDTNFAGKVNACTHALDNGFDFVYLHIEAPDECSHRGETQNKIHALELIDQHVLAPLLAHLNRSDQDYKIMILPDHATPLSLKTHTSDPVPFLIYQKSKQGDPSSIPLFDEQHCANTDILIDPGHTMLQYFMAY